MILALQGHQTIAISQLSSAALKIALNKIAIIRQTKQGSAATGMPEPIPLAKLYQLTARNSNRFTANLRHA